MDVKNIFVKMKNYIGSEFSVYLISQTYKKKFNESLNMMKYHIDILENDGKIEEFDPLNSPKVVEECINYLINVSTVTKLDNMFRQFMGDYVFIVHNWNHNVWKNNNFNSKIQYLQRVVDNSLSMDESINMLNKLSVDLGRYKEWLPPEFELSQHYYNLLKEE